jgi:uncharacterized membrane protein YqgA involved in biofilm formation
MTGTLINVATVVAGSLLGMTLGARLPERFRSIATQALGLTVLLLGLSMALKTQSPIVVLVSLVFGGLAGEALDVEARLDGLGSWIYRRAAPVAPADGALPGAPEVPSGSRRPASVGETPALPAAARFSQALVTASLVYCVGPMTIIGSIQDGLQGDFSTLSVKAALDGIASVAFAATMGIGVLFSAVVVLLYQGALSLAAASARDWLTEPMIREMTAAGGLIMLGIGMRLLELKRLPVANFLPALFFAPLFVALAARLGL